MKGDNNKMSFTKAIMGLTVSVIVTTTVLIPTIKDVNVDAYTAAEKSMVILAALIAVIGLVYGIGAAFGMM